MKSGSILISLLLTTSGLVAQDFLWSKKSENQAGAYSDPRGIGTDSLGNVYCTGYYSGMIDLNPSGTGGEWSTGSHEIYVVKYDVDGNYLWSFNLESAFYQDITALVVDKSGNVYLTGSILGTTDFDPSTNTYFLGPQNSNYNAFIAKYNTSGEFQWAYCIGDTEMSNGSAIALDNTGNIIMAGTFDGTIDFDPGGSSVELISGNEADIFLMKYSNEGDFIWAKKLSGEGSNYAVYDIATDHQDNFLITGTYSDSIDMDPSDGLFYLGEGEGRDVFIAKYSPEGELFWANKAGGQAFDDVPNDVTVDVWGNVYVVGVTSGDFTIYDSNSSIDLMCGGESDGFFAKYDPSGELVLGKLLTGSQSQYAQNCIVSNTGEFYLSFYNFGVDVEFDLDDNVDAEDLTDANPVMIIAKYDVNTSLQWYGTLSSEPYEIFVNQMILSNNTRLLMTGQFSDTLDFALAEDEVYAMSTATNQFTFFVSSHEVECIDVQYVESTAVNCNSAFSGTATVQLSNPNSIASMEWEPGTPDGDGTEQISNLGTGNWTCLITDTSGCTRTVVLNVGQNEPSLIVIKDTVCFEYVLNGVSYSSSGTYYQNYTDVHGCDSVIELQLMINNPDLTISFLDQVTLTAVNGADQYQWVNCSDGEPVPGENNVIFSPPANGVYAVTVSDEGCTSTSDCITVNSVSMVENILDITFIAPNPANNYAIIQSTNSGILSIYSMSGERISTLSVNEKETFIDLSLYDTGSYLVTLQTDDELFRQKLIIK